MPVTLFDYKTIQEDFKEILHGRWVRSQNLHLTLKFFGDTYDKEFLIQRLSSLNLQAEASELKSLALLNENKILYAQTQNPSLQRIHAQIQKAFILPDEQAFIPHITLMRIKKIPDKIVLDEKIKKYEDKPIGKLHPKIELIQSVLTPQGAKYTTLKVFGK